MSPSGIRQAFLQARLSMRGRPVHFGPGARIDGRDEFGDNVSLDAGAAVYGSAVGRWTDFGENSLVIGADIGAFCSVAPQAIIGGGVRTKGNVTALPSFAGALRRPRAVQRPRTRMGNDVWVLHSAVVLPGVRLGDGAVVGEGAVVDRDVEPYAVVAGVPAKIVRWRFDAEDVEWLLETKWWNWPQARVRLLRPQYTTVAALRAAVGSPAARMAAGGEP